MEDIRRKFEGYLLLSNKAVRKKPVVFTYCAHLFASTDRMFLLRVENTC